MKAKRILASVLSVALLLQLSPLGVLALDESLPQTPQVCTVQENLDPAPTAEHQPSRPVTAGAMPLQKRMGGFHIRPCLLAARINFRGRI